MADDADPIFDTPEGLARLLAVMARLRDPDGGCPWDLEQDFASIAPYTIEEAYEVADAIARGDRTDLKGELGDLLLQVVYHAQMAQEEGSFDFDAVARGVTDKMISRHPHVFGGEGRDKSAAQQVADWETAKAAERASRAETGALDGVALGLPALMRAVKLQKRAARAGFDWEDVDGVIGKVAEEAEELARARDGVSPREIAEEMGDMLFTMVNLSRHLGVDPEAALRDANAKFTRRFSHIETALEARGMTVASQDITALDDLWREAKRREKK
ncbi:nucleoside triphosphate pyrophosphohydrolase [Profundibacterium mesophilum]|nr:nucleoside triphosphate pyrophosphohydrolase [Profundibacterium mesophilum]